MPRFFKAARISSSKMILRHIYLCRPTMTVTTPMSNFTEPLTRAALLWKDHIERISRNMKLTDMITNPQNEIAWHRTVTKDDGEIIEEQILSRYKFAKITLFPPSTHNTRKNRKNTFSQRKSTFLQIAECCNRTLPITKLHCAWP